MAPYLQGQHRPSAQVRATWRFDAPDSTAMLTPRRSSTLAAFTHLSGLRDDFDAALGCLRTLAGAQDFAEMRSYLSTAAKHGRRPFDVLTELTSGNVWIPATT